MDSPPPGLATLLARLAASGTDFVLVGALAAVAQGAPLTTFDVDALLGDGHQLLSTSLGQLDVFGAVEGGRGYEELALDSVTVVVEGQPVKVLGLRALPELKRDATSAKGRLALAVLEETLRRTNL